ncbi:MAG: outer membrane beta-barrel protein [Polyangiaceae bacterium]
MRNLPLLLSLSILLVAGTTHADDDAKPSWTPKVTPVGYVEAYWAWNFNRPSNDITNYRGFDNRHNSITLSNAALGATFESGPVGGKIMLQVGSQPSTAYASEPVLGGASGANATGPDLWKHIQEAYLTYRIPAGKGIDLQAGIVASPVGIEYLAVKDNWNWSRSNLFFALPAYHTGLRATYAWTDEVSTTASVFNGWNDVVDNNEEKSVEANVNYKRGSFAGQLLYFGGVERPSGAAEGPYWRHTFDALAQVDATKWLSFMGEADAGFEPNRFGTASWIAYAGYARVQPLHGLFVAGRFDRFAEHVAADANGASTPLFWGGASWVSSGTLTVEERPAEGISFRLEGRHDVSSKPLFFGQNVTGDGSNDAPYVANARTQDTVLLGATAWFQ